MRRCYEVRCETGVVTANFSSSGARIPYNISNGYIEPGLNYATLEDDYQRTYAGNPLMSQNMLFTQCYNNTLVSCPLTTAAPQCGCTCRDNAAPDVPVSPQLSAQRDSLAARHRGVGKRIASVLGLALEPCLALQKGKWCCNHP